MATLTLKIKNITSELKFNDKAATEVCSRAWDAYHRKGEEASEQEKLDWVLETLFVKTLERASARKDSKDEHEACKAQHEARREARKNAPKLKVALDK